MRNEYPHDVGHTPLNSKRSKHEYLLKTNKKKLVVTYSTSSFDFYLIGRDGDRLSVTQKFQPAVSALKNQQTNEPTNQRTNLPTNYPTFSEKSPNTLTKRGEMENTLEIIITHLNLDLE